MEPLCKNCRYWESQHQLCHKRFVDVPNEREFKPDMMRVSVYPGGIGPGQFVCSVFTGPEFGCVHFVAATRKD